VGATFAHPQEALAFLERLSNALQRGTLKSANPDVSIATGSAAMRMHCGSCTERFVLLQPPAGRIEWRSEGETP